MGWGCRLGASTLTQGDIQLMRLLEERALGIKEHTVYHGHLQVSLFLLLIFFSDYCFCKAQSLVELARTKTKPEIK